jgi:energy-coupling factor transport system ATP-binding protein
MKHPAAPKLCVSALGFAYPQGDAVFNDISFNLRPGTRTLLCGRTGCGKSTLLRCLKPELTPVGSLQGTVVLGGADLQTLQPQDSAAQLGFVMQDPSQQLVMDTVRSELAFGLENLGMPSGSIHRRIAEIAYYFNIQSWIDKPLTELSGGQRQLVNLAAVLAMQPRVLLLDEAAAQLDPIARRDFNNLVARVVEELDVCALQVDHDLEESFAAADQVLYLKDASLAFAGEPGDFAQYLQESEDDFLAALPYKARRRYSTQRRVAPGVASNNKHGKGQAALAAKGVWFKYTKSSPYVLRDLSFALHGGQVQAIVGGNASGKSTLLGVLAGALRPQHGAVRRSSGIRLAALPQDPLTLFFADSARDELANTAGQYGCGEGAADAMLARMGLADTAAAHPFDLSSGQQQKLALGKLLLTGADVYLLDEPTRGLDYFARQELALLIREQRAAGKAILITSHDLDFVADVADTVSMAFDGTLMATAPASEFFAANLFYTTAAMRLREAVVPVAAAAESAAETSSCGGLGEAALPGHADAAACSVGADERDHTSERGGAPHTDTAVAHEGGGGLSEAAK